MKLAVATILLAVLLIGVQAAPTSFDLGDMKGMVEAMSVVDGEKIPIDPKALTKVEELIKSVIHKRLNKKRMSKKAARHGVPKPVEEKIVKAEQEVLPVQPELKSPEPVAQPQFPKSIKWEEHAESRDLINQRVPGGTEAIDALVKLIQEQSAQK